MIRLLVIVACLVVIYFLIKHENRDRYPAEARCQRCRQTKRVRR